jgi:hypothetical protein
MISYIVNRKIHRVLNGIDKEDQLQSIIHPELDFRRNSINLLISRRGVGKTFTVMKELIKLSELPECGGYNMFLYITDKSNDNTVNELIKLIKLKTKIVHYSDALEVLKDIMSAKSAYEQIISKNLEQKITDTSKEDILSTLCMDDFLDYVPHTAILLDDAMNVLKDPKYKLLRDLLFQNRQPKFTIFICVQDAFGIPPSIKRNIDTAFIFAGFTDKTMFGMMVKQLGSPMNSADLWEKYNRLGFRDALIFDYVGGRMKLSILYN